MNIELNYNNERLTMFIKNRLNSHKINNFGLN
jgi:hypothetical protein